MFILRAFSRIVSKTPVSLHEFLIKLHLPFRLPAIQAHSTHQCSSQKKQHQQGSQTRGEKRGPPSITQKSRYSENNRSRNGANPFHHPLHIVDCPPAQGSIHRPSFQIVPFLILISRISQVFKVGLQECISHTTQFLPHHLTLGDAVYFPDSL